MTTASDYTSRRVFEVMLIDDDPDDVRLTIKALAGGAPHVRVTVEADGVDALRQLHRRVKDRDIGLPDLIFLDLNMPRMDGREFLQRVKRDDSLRSIPIVILTTSARDQDVAASYAAHANSFVTKPPEYAEFKRTIQTLRDYWFSVVTLPTFWQAELN